MGAAAVAASLVVLLALLVADDAGSNGFDRRIAHRLVAPEGSTRLRWADHVSSLGSAAVVVVAAVALAVWCQWRTRNPRLTLLCLLAPALVGLAQALLKEVVRRPAPGDHVPASVFSFPSGHAAGAWSIALTFVIVAEVAMRPGWMRRVAVTLALGGAVAVAVARVVVGDHYATDVVAGALLATAITLALAAWLTESRLLSPSSPAR